MKVAEDMRERASERIKGWLAELAGWLHASISRNEHTHAHTDRTATKTKINGRMLVVII
jgi:argininosuccinate lyase